MSLGYVILFKFVPCPLSPVSVLLWVNVLENPWYMCLKRCITIRLESVIHLVVSDSLQPHGL